jgi:peptidoglycan/LPS O-acetylase OafA/YrhL
MQGQVAFGRADRAPGPSVRLHYLDWLRALAILDVFLYHAVHPFDITDWTIKNAELSEAVTVFLGLLFPWGMPFFFLIAGGFTWLSMAYSLWEGFMGTAMVVTTLVWCRDRFDRQTRLLRSMSHASYAVYVLHPLLIVPLALMLSSIPLGLSVKFVLVAPLAVALCFLAGHLVRRLPVVRGIL